MQKAFSIALLGLASAGLTLATPAESQADHFGCGYGGGGFYRGGYGGGYGGGYYGGGLGYSDYGNGYRSSGFYSSGFRGGYDDCGFGGYSRPTIVHPEYYHYSPGRGVHSHGHMHVPHRGHYHTIPY